MQTSHHAAAFLENDKKEAKVARFLRVDIDKFFLVIVVDAAEKLFSKLLLSARDGSRKRNGWMMMMMRAKNVYNNDNEFRS